MSIAMFLPLYLMVLSMKIPSTLSRASRPCSLNGQECDVKAATAMTIRPLRPESAGKHSWSSVGIPAEPSGINVRGASPKTSQRAT
jgi:hypothetical protein